MSDPLPHSSTPPRRSPSKSSTEMKRTWQPSESVPLISLDARSSVRRAVSGDGGRGQGGGRGVEKNLTDLYMENAKAQIPEERPSKRSRGWGWGGLVDTAYSASVFGAALGLTAYRVIASTSSGGRKEGSALGSERGDENPPPAYEETAKVQTGLNNVGEVADGWEELDEGQTEVITPTHSRTSTQQSHHFRHRSSPSSSSQSYPQPKIYAKSNHHRNKSSLSNIKAKPRTPRSSIYIQPTMTVVDDLFSTATIPHLDPALPDGEDEEDVGEERVDQRLDSMNKRLSELILEGQKALGERPVFSGGDWVDEVGDEGVR